MGGLRLLRDEVRQSRLSHSSVSIWTTTARSSQKSWISSLRFARTPIFTGRGKHRAPLTGQAAYPRPLQNPLPIWVGVGGTPESFVRAGTLGLPLMVAIIGG